MTFEELRSRTSKEPEELNESLLRKGAALAFAARARSDGLKLERKLASAKETLRPRAGDSLQEQLKRIQEGLFEICEAQLEQRRLLGNLTAIVVSGQLLNERNSATLQRIERGRGKR